MRYVSWAQKAREDLRGIHDYVAVHDPAAAQRLVRCIRAIGESLVDFPHKGRAIRRGSRQITASYPYILRYRVKADLIEILRVYHGARNVRSPRLDYSAQPAIA